MGQSTAKDDFNSDELDRTQHMPDTSLPPLNDPHQMIVTPIISSFGPRQDPDQIPRALLLLSPVLVSLKPNIAHATIGPLTTSKNLQPSPYPSPQDTSTLHYILDANTSGLNTQIISTSFSEHNTIEAPLKHPTTEANLSTLQNPHKRKALIQDFEIFSKRLRKAIAGLEPVYFDPETISLIPQSSLECFISHYKHKSKLTHRKQSKSFNARFINPIVVASHCHNSLDFSTWLSLLLRLRRRALSWPHLHHENP